MPRKAHIDPPTAIKIYLPKSLMDEIDFLLFDPIRGRRKYAALSLLVQRLLKNWIEEEQVKET